MKILTARLLVLGAPLLFLGCATVAPPQPPSLDLPKPPTDLRAVRKGDRVILTWTVPTVTTDRQAARNLGPTRICRGLGELKECGTPIGKTPGRLSSGKSGRKIADSYDDTLLPEMQNDPSSFLTYAVEVPNPNGRSAGLSNQVRVSLARVMPPPADFQARVTGRGIELSWKSEIPAGSAQPGAHYEVRVNRRALDGSGQTIVGQVPAGGEQGITDTSIEWEKTYEYRAETVTVIDQANKAPLEVEGDDTPAVKVYADDVFPPAVPSGLQAVFSGPGQKPFIDLVWAPVTDIDLAGYNVYRSEDETAPVKLNSEPLKTPAYRDSSVSSRKQYAYSVTSVDLRGNESARSEPASESVP
ncbi:MAG TPA: hypothetical protein VKQ11_22310 [Candidatus Sulfotelmatobacter sp.]|nr:hypothetical protein [Candidatus Sulfotelmatobacter sp.]